MSAAIATAAALALPISFSRSSKINTKRVIGFGGSFRVFAILGEESGSIERRNPWSSLFEVEDPRSKTPQYNKGKFLDAYQALEVARYDIQYCDWKARQDVLTIMLLHEKVVEVLNPLAREFKSIGTLKRELAELQEELSLAHNQVHISEARVSTAVDKLAYMETLVNDKILQERNTNEDNISHPSTSTTTKSRQPRRSLNVSGPVQPYNPRLKNFWYPVAFTADLKDDTMVPLDCFEEPWVLFRGKDGKPGCVQNTCAHRACPLDLGSVSEGRIQCPYHGWEYSTDGKCEKMPSTKLLNVRIKAIPCFEQDGMIWIWPGSDPPTASIPSLLPPVGFQIHAEHGEVLDAFNRPARLLGPVPDRHGIPATLHGSIDHRNLQAGQTRRAEHEGMLDASPPASCLLAFVEKQDETVIQNVARLRSDSEACPFHAVSVETLRRKGFE